MIAPARDLLTTAEVARLLKLSRWTVNLLTRKGRLRATVTPKTKRISKLYTRDEVTRFLQGKKSILHCKGCRCRLRLDNPGPLCWACGHPGEGKDGPSPEDILRSGASRVRSNAVRFHGDRILVDGDDEN